MGGKQIKLFLVDWTAGGLTTAEITNWTGHVLSARRSDLSDLLQREEAQRTGVYFLLGDDEEAVGGIRLYVGEADVVAQRLKYHDREKNVLGSCCPGHLQGLQHHQTPCAIPGVPADHGRRCSGARNAGEQRPAAPSSTARSRSIRYGLLPGSATNRPAGAWCQGAPWPKSADPSRSRIQRRNE